MGPGPPSTGDDLTRGLEGQQGGLHPVGVEKRPASQPQGQFVVDMERIGLAVTGDDGRDLALDLGCPDPSEKVRGDAGRDG